MEVGVGFAGRVGISLVLVRISTNMEIRPETLAAFVPQILLF